MDRRIMSGNEAVALGAFEAGARVGTGYPGTPSTEIMENFTRYDGVYTEWSVNEKVALEVALGSAMAGARTLVTMKHVGLNVAADPLFTASYTGIKAGLVIAVADDPAMHSSQNEQDSRNYAAAAKLPMLEPADSQEAKDYTARAFALSEQYDTPVFVRSTTRVSHGKTVVVPSDSPEAPPPQPAFERDVHKYVMIPAYARLRHVEVEKRMRRLEQDANSLDLNVVHPGSTETGIITSGISFTYVCEAYPDASVLKLGMVNPLPLEVIREFIQSVNKTYVVEELDPFLETRILAAGMDITGKKHLPLTGEFDPDTVSRALGGTTAEGLSTDFPVPPRPPSLCPGCPHRTVFTILRDLGLTVTGDIGCYTLGALPPYLAMDTCIDMGASIGVAQGIEIAEGDATPRKTVAVIGDSTFTHSGLTGLVNAVYNGRNTLTIILDNGTTAMTGMQPNPLSGERINGEPAYAIDYEKMAAAFGIPEDNCRIVDAYKPKDIENGITGLLAAPGVALLVVKGPCVIDKRRKKRKK